MKRHQVYTIAAMILLFAIGYHVVMTVNAQNRRLPIYSVEVQEKQVALTFDAAWENTDTEKLMKILDRYHVKATFFATGDWCDRFPEDVKKLYQSGHAIQNHSDRHPHVAQISKEQILADTQRCNEKIKELTGEEPCLYRAPYGEYNNRVLSTIEDTMGMKVIQWDVDSRDWKRISADEMLQKMLPKIQNGSILLFHNDLPNTPQAVERLLALLIGQGYEFVKVRDLIYKDSYRIDVQGRQFPMTPSHP